MFLEKDFLSSGEAGVKILTLEGAWHVQPPWKGGCCDRCYTKWGNDFCSVGYVG